VGESSELEVGSGDTSRLCSCFALSCRRIWGISKAVRASRARVRVRAFETVREGPVKKKSRKGGDMLVMNMIRQPR
jgi:hypothetical protein